MNNRLYKIASYIKDGIGVIDVGTDHGYLPIELCERNYSGNIIASDINSDPLNKAVKAASEAGFSDRIEFLLCDGLSDCCPEKIDRIVIAGMGGDTICGIVENAAWCKSECYTLYLQPMSKSEVLRKWLIDNGFGIIAEDLVVDNDTIYQIISARYGIASELNQAELFVGKKQMHSDIALYEEYKDKQIQRFKKAINGMQCAENRDMHIRIEEYKIILEELERV